MSIYCTLGKCYENVSAWERECALACVLGRGLQCLSTPSILAFKPETRESLTSAFPPSPPAISQALPVVLSKYGSHLAPPCFSLASLLSALYQRPPSSSSSFHLSHRHCLDTY